MGISQYFKQPPGLIPRTINAYNVTLEGSMPFSVGFGAYGAYKAPTGHKIAGGLAGALSFGIASLGTIAITAAVPGIPPILTDMILQNLIAEPIDKAVQATVQPLIDFGTNMRRHGFGGRYNDTQQAYTMRSAAAREMSGSLMNARQWLGQEGAFLHQ